MRKEENTISSWRWGRKSITHRRVRKSCMGQQQAEPAWGKLQKRFHQRILNICYSHRRVDIFANKFINLDIQTNSTNCRRGRQKQDFRNKQRWTNQKDVIVTWMEKQSTEDNNGLGETTASVNNKYDQIDYTSTNPNFVRKCCNE